jgi:hypothetical protein
LFVVFEGGDQPLGSGAGGVVFAPVAGVGERQRGEVLLT